MGSGDHGRNSSGCAQLLPVSVETLLWLGLPKDVVLSVYRGLISAHTPRGFSRRGSQSTEDESRGPCNDVIHTGNDLSGTLSRGSIDDVIRHGSDATGIPSRDLSPNIYTGSGATNSESRAAINSNITASALLLAVEDALRSVGHDPWRHHDHNIVSSPVNDHEESRVGHWTSQDLQDDGERHHSETSSQSDTGQQQQQQQQTVSDHSLVSADHRVSAASRGVDPSQENTSSSVDTSQEDILSSVDISQENTPSSVDISQENTPSSIDNSQESTRTDTSISVTVPTTASSFRSEPSHTPISTSAVDASVVNHTTAGQCKSQPPSSATENSLAVTGERTMDSTETHQTVSSRASNSARSQGTEGVQLPAERAQQSTSLLPSARRGVHESPPLIASTASCPASMLTASTTTEPSATDFTEKERTPSDTTAGERSRQLQRLRALRAENKRLKARQTCRHCHVRPVTLTLLPCGHFCFCEECGSSFTACPLCRKTILADVRTFVS